MTNRPAIRQLVKMMVYGGLISFSTSGFASAFQLWEQDAASVGTYHAGRVAQADDASIAYYNPAGMSRIHNQQLVVGDVMVNSNLQYKGSVTIYDQVTNLPGRLFPIGNFTNVSAQGGSLGQIPNLHYVAPLNDNLDFGLSLAVPFGLKTDYGRNTPLSYVANLSQIQVIDLSPSLGAKVWKGLSLGIGLDAERMSAELSQIAYAGPNTNTDADNKGWSTAYGFHIGGLYEFLPTSRIGLTFNSSVKHHLTGWSRLQGPIAQRATLIANGAAGAISSRATVDITLPAYLTLSGFHKVNDYFALMATAIYTKWDRFQNLTVNNVASVNLVFSPFFGPIPVPSTTASVSMNEYYRNTWNVAFGGEVYATDKVTLRAGLGYDQSPVKDVYRDARVPDNDRFAVALGGHYQATQTIGVDVGWTHLFLLNASRVNPPAMVTGAQVAFTNGIVTGHADVFAAQLKIDFA